MKSSVKQQTKLIVREIKCSTVLHKLNFGSSSEYTANLYRGCSHGCVYCYAPSLIHDEREWGTYVDAKVNAPQVLDRELGRMPKAVVFLSSASDPYQPVEARFEITKRCLEVLLEHDFPLTILTRSPLILRDVELLKKFRWVRIGFSISSVSDRFYEPGVVPLERRLETLRRLHDYGITTWVSMAPIVPGLILNDVNTLFKELKDAGVSAVSVGLLRFMGYEESRIMFEQKVGLSASEVMAGGMEIHQKVSKLAKEYGLDGCDAVLGWNDDTKRQYERTLDKFFGQEKAEGDQPIQIHNM